MNTNKLGFRTLTTYLMAHETHSDDKEDIAGRISRECGVDVDWALNYKWRGGENETDIIRAWVGKTKTRQQLADELIETCYVLIEHCMDMGEIRTDTGWTDSESLREFLESYLIEFEVSDV